MSTTHAVGRRLDRRTAAHVARRKALLDVTDYTEARARRVHPHSPRTARRVVRRTLRTINPEGLI